jgi:hypothetical protein
MLKSLIGKEVGKVQTPEFMEAFSESMTSLINRLLDANIVEAVFFQNWMIQ